MNDQLARAIKLARLTGDRLLIFDSSRNDQGFVVMSIDEYEKLALKKTGVIGLTEDELMDKINRDIAIWKNEQDEIRDHQPANMTARYSESPFDWTDKERFDQRTRQKASSWRIPRERKEAAEEVIEEDRQYLEDIDESEF
jgi:hypothetical protein